MSVELGSAMDGSSVPAFSGPIPSAIISGSDCTSPGILKTLGDAYDALALFTLGLSMSTPNLPSYTPPTAKVAALLIGAKLVVDPLLTMVFVQLLAKGSVDMQSLALYGFLCESPRYHHNIRFH